MAYSGEYLTLNDQGHVIRNIPTSGSPDILVDLTALDGGSSFFGLAAAAISSYARRLRMPASEAYIILGANKLLTL